MGQAVVIQGSVASIRWNHCYPEWNTHPGRPNGIRSRYRWVLSRYSIVEFNSTLLFVVVTSWWRGSYNIHCFHQATHFFYENLPVVVCRSLLGPMGCIPWKCHCMLTKNDSVWLLFSTYLLLVVWLTTGTELGLLYHSKIEILVSTSFLSTIPIDTYVFSDLARIHRSHLLKYLFLYPLVPQERNYSPTYHVFR